MTAALLRLRADAYYVPVADGVWIRTTDGSFTLRGKNVATWVERLAPILDRGITVDDLLAGLGAEQADYARQLLHALERHGVVRREPLDGVPVPPELEYAYPQAVEFLRHFTADAGRALVQVRACRIGVAGPVERAAALAAALLETGFADITLTDVEPPDDLLAMAADLAAAGVPTQVTGPGWHGDIQHVLGVFDTGETEAAMALADRAGGTGSGAWIGLVAGQAMLLKAQLPESDTACLRCAWRRLVHPAVDLPATSGLGHVPVAVAGAVLAQDLFRQVSGAIAAARGPAAEGVVVDLTRLSIWRTPIDPDPTCPCRGTRTRPEVTTDTGAARPERQDNVGELADRLLGARCFGPLTSCSPESLAQLPLAAVRPRINPVGRPGPVGHADGPIVVAETLETARLEALLLGVEHELSVAVRGALDPSADIAVGAGFSRAEALARAVGHWLADHAGAGWTEQATTCDEVARPLADLVGADLPAVRLARHTSGLWRAGTDRFGPVTGRSAESATTAALLGWIAVGVQFPDSRPGDVRVAIEDPNAGDQAVDQAAALGLADRTVPVPALVGDQLVGVAVGPRDVLEQDR